jgi:phosphohistidine phosphatase
MKTLFLVRHAKSSWKYKDLSDLERPLNSRGRRDAPFMGKLLYRQNIKPEVILTSPAVRAVSTVKFFCDEMDIPFEEVEILPGLYMPDPEEILQLIGELEDSVNTAMIFSHNPGITDFYNMISDSYIDNIPTCGIAGIEFRENSWNDLTQKKGQLLLFEYPKKYFSGKN